MAIDNTVSSDFDPRSSIVKSVFDCHLSSVRIQQFKHLFVNNIQFYGLNPLTVLLEIAFLCFKLTLKAYIPVKGFY